MRTVESRRGTFPVISLAEVEAYRDQGPGHTSGKHLRFYCPIHGGDNQRSFSVNTENGWFRCHSCQERGLVEDFAEDQRPTCGAGAGASLGRPGARWRPPPEADPDLVPVVERLQEALRGHGHTAFHARQYLQERGVSVATAARYGVGFADDGAWPHHSDDGKPLMQWRFGRIAFPLTDPAGGIVSLYGRAVRRHRIDAPRPHVKLPRPQGLFNAVALRACERVVLCEGAFDALSLAEVGVEGAVALCGARLTAGTWPWFRDVREVVVALDDDATGRERAAELALGLKLLGKRVGVVTSEAYAGCKDLNEALVASRLDAAAFVEPIEG